MNQKLFFIAISLFALSACGTNKKLQTAQLQIDELQARNNELNKNQTSLQQQLKSSNDANLALSDEYKKYKVSCEGTAVKYAAAMKIIHGEEEKLKAIKTKLDNALEDFASKGAEIYYKNGYLYVSLRDDLLYKSGSSKLGQPGEEALSALAGILGDYPDLKIVVLGNTDDVLVKKGGDNWSLSTERANGVVRVLRDTYKIDPVRLTAAGKGKYNPVADNATAEGRAKNRRTEIILNPDLDKLWDTMY